MKIYNPYLDDRDIWPLLPNEDRWIMNKMEVALTQGIEAAPVGVRIKKQGTYCLRHIMNMAGRGIGGVIKFEAKNTQQGILQPDYRPATFWTPWLDGHHTWTEYIDDVPVRQSGGYEKNGRLDSYEETPSVQLPEVFHGISRYMTTESIDGVIIEVSPRHMAAMPSAITIRDYRQFVPDYKGLPLSDSKDLIKVEDEDGQGFRWKPVDGE